MERVEKVPTLRFLIWITTQRSLAHPASVMALSVMPTSAHREGAVKTHVSNILSKLHLADRTQAAIYALQRHLVPLEDALGKEDH